jgi:peptidoglycan hydrolase-like protein with peptidoglycan-binding domain
MWRRRTLALLSLMLVAAGSAHAFIPDEEVFNSPSTDSLAPQDEYGTLHQGKALNSTDFDARHHWRFIFYFKAPEQLVVESAYVGALQRDLRRLGYYCGPVDGVFSDEVSDAIARLQKNYSMRVTGTLTIPVRRALHLP